ncbi:MAG: hypothetical protein OEZ06_22655 [Myxococcales bacterium]|nr:hypothetical protein [Myxococcales bacterium]
MIAIDAATTGRFDARWGKAAGLVARATRGVVFLAVAACALPSLAQPAPDPNTPVREADAEAAQSESDAAGEDAYGTPGSATGSENDSYGPVPAGGWQSTTTSGGFDFNIYSDVGAYYVGGSAFNFEIGAIDFFARAELGDSISLLSETVVMLHGDSAMVRPARLFVQYRSGSVLRLRAGRFHTPLGFYTPQYPHGGKIFRLANRRPRLLAMEHDSAILPNHLTGIAAQVSVDVGFADWRLDLAVGDQRVNSLAVGNELAKAAVVRLSLLPQRWAGDLDFGVSLWLNHQHVDVDPSAVPPPGPDATWTFPEVLWEQLAVPYVAYMHYPVEFIAEFFALRHGEDFSGGRRYRLFGGFIQLGRSLGSWTPYARFEHFQRDAFNPLYLGHPAPIRLTEATAGLRWTIDPRLIARFEFGYEFEDNDPVGGIQLAFGF